MKFNKPKKSAFVRTHLDGTVSFYDSNKKQITVCSRCMVNEGSSEFTCPHLLDAFCEEVSCNCCSDCEGVCSDEI